MGIYLASSMSIGAVLERELMYKVLVRMADMADDNDSHENNRERGRNIFPSMKNLSYQVGGEQRNVEKNVQRLKEMGWIREYQTSKYLRNKGTVQFNTPRCYEVNLSMLARRLDVQHTIWKESIRRNSDEYKKLLDATSFQEDDWTTRLWVPNYSPRHLTWDRSTLDGITPKLWDSTTDDTDVSTNTQTISLESYDLRKDFATRRA